MKDKKNKDTRQEVDEKIARGLAQLERGEGLDGEEFFEQLRKRGPELRARTNDVLHLSRMLRRYKTAFLC